MSETRTEPGATGTGGDCGRLSLIVERLQGRPLFLWLAVFAVTLVAFYALDHLIMSGQGLPLGLDLTPAQ